MSKDSAMAMIAQIPAPTPPPQVVDATIAATADTTTTEGSTELQSSRIAHLAKKEQEIFKNREAVKAIKAEFEAEKAKFEAEKAALLEAKNRLTQFDELKQKDAVAAIKFAGFTDTDILNYFAGLEDKSTPEEKAVKAAQSEINKFKDEMASKEKAQFEAKINEDVTYFKTATERELLSDKEKYEYCNHFGPLAEDLIHATAAEVIKQEGAPQTKEAFQKLAKEVITMVEEYYEEQDKAMGTIKKRTPKEAKEHAMAQIAELKPEVSPGQPGKSPTKTLSSRATATTAAAITSRKETSSEKRERLMNMLANMGKKTP